MRSRILPFIGRSANDRSSSTATLSAATLMVPETPVRLSEASCSETHLASMPYLADRRSANSESRFLTSSRGRECACSMFSLAIDAPYHVLAYAVEMRLTQFASSGG